MGAPFDKGVAMILSVVPGRVRAGRWVYPFWKSSLVRSFDFTLTLKSLFRIVLAETLKRSLLQLSEKLINEVILDVPHSGKWLQKEGRFLQVGAAK